MIGATVLKPCIPGEQQGLTIAVRRQPGYGIVGIVLTRGSVVQVLISQQVKAVTEWRGYLQYVICVVNIGRRAGRIGSVVIDTPAIGSIRPTIDTLGHGIETWPSSIHRLGSTRDGAVLPHQLNMLVLSLKGSRVTQGHRERGKPK